jgi:hypothetical protein
MKIKNIYKYFAVTMTTLLTVGCSDYLEEKPYSQLAPENFLKTKEGIESLMGAAYANSSNMVSNNSIYVFAADEWITDFAYQSGDGVNATALQYINYTWDASIGLLQGESWDYPYRAIRNANLVLENLDNLEVSEQNKTVYRAEARFIRAISYIKLNWKFGPVPLTQLENSVPINQVKSIISIYFLETKCV